MTKFAAAAAFSIGALLASTASYADGPKFGVRAVSGLGQGGVASLAPPPNDGAGGVAYFDILVGKGASTIGSISVTFPGFHPSSWPHCVSFAPFEGQTGSWLSSAPVFSDGGTQGVTLTGYPNNITPDGSVIHTIYWYTATPLQPGSYGLGVICRP